MNLSMDHLDGNAAAGELSRIFAVDITVQKGSVLIAAQGGDLLKRICIHIVPASWLDVRFAGMYCYDW